MKKMFLIFGVLCLFAVVVFGFSIPAQASAHVAKPNPCAQALMSSEWHLTTLLPSDNGTEESHVQFFLGEHTLTSGNFVETNSNPETPGIHHGRWECTSNRTFTWSFTETRVSGSSGGSRVIGSIEVTHKNDRFGPHHRVFVGFALSKTFDVQGNLPSTVRLSVIGVRV